MLKAINVSYYGIISLIVCSVSLPANAFSEGNISNYIQRVYQAPQ